MRLNKGVLSQNFRQVRLARARTRSDAFGRVRTHACAEDKPSIFSVLWALLTDASFAPIWNFFKIVDGPNNSEYLLILPAAFKVLMKIGARWGADYSSKKTFFTGKRSDLVKLSM